MSRKYIAREVLKRLRLGEPLGEELIRKLIRFLPELYKDSNGYDDFAKLRHDVFSAFRYDHADRLIGFDLGVCWGAISEEESVSLDYAQEITSLWVDNSKLRELVKLLLVINKYTSLCATTDCGECPVKSECDESVYLEGLLGIDAKEISWRVQERVSEASDVYNENAKLRELVRDMMRYYFMPSTIDRKQRETELIERANELGVEEDDGELGVEVDG